MTRFFAVLLTVALMGFLPLAGADPTMRAKFGSMTGGSSRSETLELERVFEDANAVANAEKDALFTIERLLQRLLKEPEVHAALSSHGIDVQALSSEIDTYLLKLRRVREGFASVTDPKLRRVIQSTMVPPQAGDARRLLSSLDVLAAIMRKENSFAADRLVAYGLKMESAANLAEADYTANRLEAEAELQQTKQKIMELAQQQPHQLKMVSGDALGDRETQGPVIADYRITVMSRDPIIEAQFKGAISASGALKLLVEETPFAFEFSASEIIAIFESVTVGDGISVALFAKQSDGTETKIGGFGGQSGVVLQDRKDLSSLWQSGYLR